MPLATQRMSFTTNNNKASMQQQGTPLRKHWAYDNTHVAYPVTLRTLQTALPYWKKYLGLLGSENSETKKKNEDIDPQIVSLRHFLK